MSNEMAWSSMKDPLKINLRRQTRVLLSKIPSDSTSVHALQNASSRPELLDTLSRLLAIPSITALVAEAFRPILFDLCARWLLDDQNADQKFIALCLLLQPHQELFPILLVFLQRTYQMDGPLAHVLSSSVKLLDAQNLHRLLLAYYRILQANRALPNDLLWPLLPLVRLIRAPHPDTGVRFLAIRCYCLQCGASEAEMVKMEKQFIGEVSDADCPITYAVNTDGTPFQMDGWIFPAFEVKRISDDRNAIVRDTPDYYSVEEGETPEPIAVEELSPFTVNIHGIFLFRNQIANLHLRPSTLVMTPGAVQSLRLLALHVSLHLPVLLTSPPSSGKSLLLSHLAGVLYPATENQIVHIHLADTSLDPRSLLGSYTTSLTKPGTFEWEEGPLISAMKQGRWVVFEDIEQGSNEVLGVLKPLIESLGSGQWIGARAAMEVPGHGRVEANEHFAIFATRSIPPAKGGKFPKPTFLGSNKFNEVVNLSPTRDELRVIIISRFPALAGDPAQAVIGLWESVRALEDAASGSVRSIGSRELEKFCARFERLFPNSNQTMNVDSSRDHDVRLSDICPNPTLREDIYLEARDVFFGSGTLTAAARYHTEHVATVVGEHLGLTHERQSWILRSRIPEMDIEKDVNGRTVALRIGRNRICANPAKEMMEPTLRPFAMHRPAISLLYRISTAISLGEPVLLTGETGTGKTSVVSHLASILRKPLISLNLSHQTESSDLLGGFKPVDTRIPASELQARFTQLFGGTFSRKKNVRFEESIRKAVLECKWSRAVTLWVEAIRLAKDRIQSRNGEETSDGHRAEGTQAPRKRRKLEAESGRLNVPEAAWLAFERDVLAFNMQHVQGKAKFAFSFVEGPLIKALRLGNWILLDEINLSGAETLERISTLLQSPTSSITLTEQGSLDPIPRHPEFRIFACMNPSTDVGKKDLPPKIRSRFTEIDVPPPDADRDTLISIVDKYIGHCTMGDKGAIMDIAEFYMAVKQLSEERKIADGSNHRPHYSMRTLARALMWAADMASTYNFRRALWEGCLMAFTMILDSPSAELVIALARRHILARVRNHGSLLSREPTIPSSPEQFIKFGPFYLEKGPLSVDCGDDYILTPSVEKKLIDLARIIVTRRFPVLVEGPTSSGKTSSIEYLAKRTGHRFVRINNHEHTDIQEYLGTYVSDPTTGRLIFKDGLLVRALRSGDWIVLDELNLAPTDVLEALNRLLDDNRELIIPETQEVIQPHPHFLLFATQNPPGVYAGRKVLSRAFRNRFLEVHFEDVPQEELETILCQRCRVAPSYAQRIVNVFQELQKRRQSGRVFESKHGFATLRDLFRWAGRAAVGYQELAENGYMLLAERARRSDDKAVVKEVIESIMNVRIDECALYDLKDHQVDYTSTLGCPLPLSSQLVWTEAMKRLYILVTKALRFNEPVLLVGETGSGKTSVCQVYAEAISNHLHTVNCHQNTETADLIGGLRPVRNRASLEADAIREATVILTQLGISDIPSGTDNLATLLDSQLKSCAHSSSYAHSLEDIRNKLRGSEVMFEWHDGPLVRAMRNGEILLLDEISLADDSVLERLNSVLEPARILVLVERGGDNTHMAQIQAREGFRLVATMNPGGDYGKKELSPALRNRFTEIWVPPVEGRRDLEAIAHSLWKHDEMQSYTRPLLDFVEWLSGQASDRSLITLRDILAWINFSNSIYFPNEHATMSLNEIFHHAAKMTYLDGLGAFPQFSAFSMDSLCRLKDSALLYLKQSVPPKADDTNANLVKDDEKCVQIGSFIMTKGPKLVVPHTFNLRAPTTLDNAMRVVRACQVSKPILLEGSPGVGKTSLISALANITGHHLARINLSDQTDLIDLFGSDLPVEGGRPGEFSWKDAEFLRALQEGHWVLLDEMNLAPQAILEGLNSVLDHRGSVYVPELGRSFYRHPAFRIFAAQNPLHQGGGRKGLPKSFLNRFTKVYMEELSPYDLLLVCRHLFPDHPVDLLRDMITFNTRLNEEIVQKRSFAREGGPWEFNLRDVIRWATLLRDQNCAPNPAEHLQTVYLQRFRSKSDRDQVLQLFTDTFSMQSPPTYDVPRPSITASYVQVGSFFSHRRNYNGGGRPCCVLHAQLQPLEALGTCLTNGWLVILTGPNESGKTSLVRLIASITGNALHETTINNATDTTDLLGSFEQVNFRSQVIELVEDVFMYLESIYRSMEYIHVHETAEYNVLKKLMASPHAFDDLKGLLNTVYTLVCGPGGLFCDSGEGSRLIGRTRAVTASLDTAGRFEWVDGPLVRALKQGHWVLLDGANLCSPAVLDRLNSLCEPDGVLTLNERGHVDGDVQVIKPHPNFRLFMSVDPRQGELSRAMRNRGVEIALIPSLTQEDHRTILQHHRLPLSETFSHPGSSSVRFEMWRRGLLSDVLSVDPVWSASELSGQDCICKALVDHAEPLSSSVLAPKAEDALLSFVVQSVPPGYLAYFIRFIHALSPFSQCTTLPRVVSILRSLPSHPISSAFSQLREQSCDMWKVPSDFLSLQPMDFFLNSLPFYALQGETERSRHERNLRILNLYVDVYVAHENGRAPHLIEEHTTRNTIRGILVNNQPRVSQATTEIEGLLDTIIATGRTILEYDLIDQAPEHLLTASQLLRYGNYLGQILNNVIFDYSAVQIISRWIADSVRDTSPIFNNVMIHAYRLEDVVSLSSGFGFHDIWSALLAERQSRLHTQSSSELEVLACCCNDVLARFDIRSRIFQLISLQTLPTTLTPEQLKLLEGLNKRVKDELESCRDRDHERSFLDPSFFLVEINVLRITGGVGVMSQQSTQLIQRVINMVCHDDAQPMIRFIPYQHALWASHSDKVGIPIVVKMQKHWLEITWANTSGTLQGPSLLLRPFFLNITVVKCDWNTISLAELRNYRKSLTSHLHLMSLTNTHMSRQEQLTGFLIQSILIVLLCFVPAADSDILCAAKNLSTRPDIGSPESVMQLLNLLGQMTHSHSGSSVAAALRSPLCHMANPPANEPAFAALGRCWIAFSRLLIDLYVPDTPIDPSAIQRCTEEFWKQRECVISAQIQLHKKLEKHLTGNEGNKVIGYLYNELHLVQERLSAVSVIPRREGWNVRTLNAYWSEVLQFVTQVMSPQKLDSLVAPSRSKDVSTSLRERIFQESVTGFCQRLEAAYPEYDDISGPLVWGLHHMKFSVRLAIDAGETTRSAIDSIAESLVAFPSILCAEGLLAGTLTKVGTTFGPFTPVSLSLQAITFKVSVGIDLRHLAPTLAQAYDQAIGLWLIDREREEDSNNSASSLYRRNNLTAEYADGDQERRDFLELFPDFEDSLNANFQSEMQKTKGNQTLIEPQHSRELSQLHHVLMSGIIMADPTKTFQARRRDNLRLILESHFSELSDTLDTTSLHYQSIMLQDRVASLQEGCGGDGRPYDFYRDANVYELDCATIIVQALRKRLCQLILEWPEQMVLHHLRDRCDSLLSLHINSPVAQVLAALEQLLLQSEDWEMYANRHNTLASHRRELIDLIVRWRRLELSCWNALLEAETRKFAEGVSDWWFQLYEALIRGYDAAMGNSLLDKSAAEVYLNGLVPLIDEFFAKSPTGQFASRMQLAEDFEVYIGHIAATKEASRSSLFQRVQRILHNTRRYYSQFSATISANFFQQRGVLEKEIQGLIKLASWKDINVQALRQSAQRTHHQLHKCIRKFREILRQPIIVFLNPVRAGEAEKTRLHFFGSPFPPIPLESFQPSFPVVPAVRAQRVAHLVDIGRTFSKFDSLITHNLRSFINSSCSVKVDELAVQIIVGSNALAKETVSSTLTKEKRQKHLNALFVRKRNAWSNLLKELKRVGISANVKPEVLQEQQDERWMKEQPVLYASSDGIVFGEKGDLYFYRLLGLLPELRATTADHHQDITTRELQRGIALLESGVSLALGSRAAFANLLCRRGRLSTACRRLRMIFSCPQVSISGTRLVDQVMEVKDTTWMLRSGLNELHDALLLLDDLDDKKDIDEVRDELRTSALDMMEKLCKSVSDLVDHVQLTGLPVLLECERISLLDAIKDMSLISNHLKTRASINPRLLHLLLPLATWLDNVSWPNFDTEPRSCNPLSHERVDGIIDTLLLDVQSILKFCGPQDQTEDDLDFKDNFIRDGLRQVETITRSLHLDNVLALVDSVLAEFVTSPENEVKDALARFFPFLDRYVILVDDQLVNHGQWTGAMLKLNYILCSVFQTIAKDGFCKPPETEVDDEDDGVTDPGDGVGLGEGSGNENVSKEIEDESQVEGLQDEGTENGQQGESTGDDNAIEMSQDTGGDLQDMDDSEMQEKNQSDDESEVDPEEQVGNLGGDDPSTVDEKLWGDGSGPKDSASSDDKVNQDYSKQDNKNSDVVAKEKPHKSLDKGEEKDLSDEPDKCSDQDVLGDDPETEDPSANGAPMEDYVDEANTLDLPEDMNLGEDAEMKHPEDADSDKDLIPDNPGSDGGQDTPDVPELNREDDPDIDSREIDEDVDQTGRTQEADTEDDQPPNKDQADKQLFVQPDVHSGNEGGGSPEAGALGIRTEPEQGDLGVQGDGEESPSQGDARDEPSTDPQEHVSKEFAGDTAQGKDGHGSSVSQVGKEQPPPQSAQLSNNPLRNLGDTLKEVRRGLDRIFDSDDRHEETREPSAVAPGDLRQLQYTRPDEDDQDMQALGTAGDEQAAKLNDLHLIDEEQPPDEFMPMDVDPIVQPEKLERHSTSLVQSAGETKTRPGVDGGLTQDQVQHRDTNNLTAARDASSLPAQDDKDMTEDDIQNDVEVQLREWQASGQPEDGAENIWRLYESLTHDLSYALCEQLRLILEPTQATRLQGDYRTGKRLNMKKIIPYIASEYTKDKIWLRRTRPSKREYQVFIALDDSRSMAESHSVHLAFQTLALVSKALGRLEVGDIAIAKFGQKVDILHKFNGGPFTDQAGVTVVNSFKFDQKATNVLLLIEASLKILEEARERQSSGSSTSADLWQLEIVISDGICQDHERLRTVLRRAEEQRVMIVFVILDSLHSHIQSASNSSALTAPTPGTGGPAPNSILSMQQGVAFKNANGVMEVKMERYLDSFPFEYYVVLRDVEALPDILSGTLKQFFERISED